MTSVHSRRCAKCAQVFQLPSLMSRVEYCAGCDRARATAAMQARANEVAPFASMAKAAVRRDMDACATGMSADVRRALDRCAAEVRDACATGVARPASLRVPVLSEPAAIWNRVLSGDERRKLEVFAASLYAEPQKPAQPEAEMVWAPCRDSGYAGWHEVDRGGRTWRVGPSSLGAGRWRWHATTVAGEIAITGVCSSQDDARRAAEAAMRAQEAKR